MNFLSRPPSKKSLSALGKPHPKAQFSQAEDAKLTSIVKSVGENNWDLVARMMGTRNERQCMERWCKYLSPNINKTPWTEREDKLLLEKYSEIGPKWVKISKYFNNRTDASIKNRWNILLRRERNRGTNKRSSISIKKENPVKVSPTIKEEPKTIKQDEKISNIPLEKPTYVLDGKIDDLDLLFGQEFQFLF